MTDEATRGGSGALPLDIAMPRATPGLPHGETAPAGYHRATQMSASAAPSTLESPKDPLLVNADAAPAFPAAVAELTSPGGTALNGVTLRDDDAGGTALREAVKLADAGVVGWSGPASDDSAARRHGPQTLMSPSPGLSGAPPPVGYGPPSNPVVDAVLPAAAFIPAPRAEERGDGAGGAFGAPSGPPGLHGHGGAELAQWGPPGAHAGAFEARDPRYAPAGGHPGQLGSLAPPGLDPRTGRAARSNTPLIALIVVGVVVLVGAIAVVGGGALYLRSRRAVPTRAPKGSAADGAGSAAAPAAPAVPGPVTPTTTAAALAPTNPAAPPAFPNGEATPRAQPRATDAASRAMGGTKARLSALTAGSLPIEPTRSAIAAVLPRVDACFAASEFEPPNHENAAYDLEVLPTGAVTRVEVATPAGRAAKLDACVIGALRAAKLPKSPGGSRVKVLFAARLADLQQTR